MKCNILAICDEQIVYSDFLMKQLLRIDEESFQISKFSSFSQLELFCLENDVQCLVISESFEEELHRVKVKNCYYLTMDRMKSRIRQSREDEKNNVQYLYRYQSVEAIYEKLKDSFAFQEEESSIFSKQEEKVRKLVGVYNPVHRNGQTTFAKALSTYYSNKGRRVLYLNMEEYAGSSELKEDGVGDLGEVLYYLKQDIKSINFRLAAFTTQEHNYETVHPIRVSSELRRITMEEWKAFLEEILERSGYETIVLDLDSCVQGLLDILEMCDLVYMPIRRDCTGEAKREQYEMNLLKLQRESLLDKTIKKYITPVDTVNLGDIKRNVENQVEDMFR